MQYAKKWKKKKDKIDISYEAHSVNVCLKSLQGHSFGSHIFMQVLKVFKDSTIFRVAETTSHILSPS